MTYIDGYNIYIYVICVVDTVASRKLLHTLRFRVFLFHCKTEARVITCQAADFSDLALWLGQVPMLYSLAAGLCLWSAQDRCSCLAQSVTNVGSYQHESSR